MSGSPAAAAEQSLVLLEDQIPLGAWVLVLAPDGSQPAVGTRGVLPALQRVLLGPPRETALCTHSSFIWTGGGCIAIRSAGLFPPEARFVPVAVFTSETAPAGVPLAVFLRGRWKPYRWMSETRGRSRVVTRYPSGRYFSSTGATTLPVAAQLVPICRAGQPFDL
jgi:hypothetical protein